MKKYKIALIVGRFQPFHNGHLFLFKKALSMADKIIFGIGSASIYDENNPLSYEQRKQMINTVVKKFLLLEWKQQQILSVVNLSQWKTSVV